MKTEKNMYAFCESDSVLLGNEKIYLFNLKI